MPGRRVECPECGWTWMTFMSDEDLAKEEMNCPRCCCPIISGLIQELNAPKKAK